LEHPHAIRRAECEAWHPYHALIEAAYMQQAQSQHSLVNTWTVNDPQRACELRDLGVSAIITDVPDVILGALHG
jgi:glycerophosphoryl diester phosphodiesterase